MDRPLTMGPVATAMLTLLLAVSLASAAVVAQSPEPGSTEFGRALGDSIGFEYSATALLEEEPQGPPAPAALFAALAGSTPLERMLNAAKAAQRDLDGTCAQLRRSFSGDDRVCELGIVNQECQTRAQVLGARADVLRKLHQGGDRRGFFTRLASRVSRDLRTAWYRIGPAGRRILRPIGDEVKDAVMSGYVPEVGRLRRFVKRSLVRGARRELARIVDQGIERILTGSSAERMDACKDVEWATGAPSGDPGFSSGTGTVTVEGVFGQGQAGVVMTADHFLGEQCFYYQAYNPSLVDPEFPGVRVRLAFDLDGGTFTGTIAGPTYAKEFLWEAWGDFRLVVFEGTVSRVLDSVDWDLLGHGGVSLGYRMNGQCVGEEGNVLASRSGSGGGVVDIAGRIRLVNDTWLLEAWALREKDDQRFSLGLRDIEVGRWDPAVDGQAAVVIDTDGAGRDEP